MKDDKEFLDIIDDLRNNEIVCKMKNYKQHYDVSTYQHCQEVAYRSYKICKKLKLDYVSMARAAMLHDLFLYDWHDKRPHDKFTDLHAFSHPRIALENAKKITSLNEKEEDIILKHMWPLTLVLPRYKESFIITIVDKYSTLAEAVKYYKRKIFNKTK